MINRIQPLRFHRYRILLLVLGGVICGGRDAFAQFMRLGPFDLSLKGRLEGIYTTNVEQERPENATAEMEDFYFVTGLDANGVARMMPRTILNLDTGISVEKHLNRPDLDNTSSPFGRVRLDARTELARYLTAEADVSFEHLSESAEDEYAPGREKTRDPRTMFSYGAGVEWAPRWLTINSSYSFSRERHQENQFKSGDQDETTIDFGVDIKPSKYFGVGYTYQWKRTKLVNQPETDDDWETEENIYMDVPITILERPRLTYSFGLERKKTEEDQGKWEPKHTIDLGDDLPLFESPHLKLSFNAQYTYKREEEPESDDVTFIYGAKLEHQISRTAKQTFSAKQEPVDTFGSRNDTEQTSFGYLFQKNDLFIYNLNLSLGVEWKRDKPLGADAGEIERTWNYRANLTYNRMLSRRLTRIIEYAYTREESNLEDEPLVEHRVTLNYTYTF